MIEIEWLELDGVAIIRPAKHRDERGFFSEVYNRGEFADAGIEDIFVQDNHSLTVESGTIRGMHFQVNPHPIAKLVRVTRGAVWDVVVDLRESSDTYGRHVAVELSAENWAQIYVPIGFAHGFCTLLPDTEVEYKVTDHWTPEVDKGVAWDDPDLNIPWPIAPKDAILSSKDQEQPAFRELPPYFQGGE